MENERKIYTCLTLDDFVSLGHFVHLEDLLSYRTGPGVREGTAGARRGTSHSAPPVPTPLLAASMVTACHLPELLWPLISIGTVLHFWATAIERMFIAR